MSNGTETNFFTIVDMLLRKRYKLLMFAVISAILIGIGLGGVLLFRPSQRIFVQNIRILLPKKNNDQLYPNGRPFNASDLLNPLVMKRLYDDAKLEKIIPFREFTPLFSAFAYSPRNAFLEAEYQAKLSARNITSVAISELEKEYKQKLESLDDGVIRLTMMYDNRLSPMQSLAVLGHVTSTWAEFSRVTEARAFPRMVMSKNWEKMLRLNAESSRVMALDRAMNIARQMSETCSQLKKMQKERVVCLRSGESVDDISEQLEVMDSHMIAPLRQLVLQGGSLPKLDIIFIRSRIQSRLQLKRKYEAEMASLIKALDVLQAKVSGGGVSGNSPAVNDSTQFNIGDGVLAQLTTMSRNDAMNEVRKQMAADVLECGSKTATVDAELAFYNDMLTLTKKENAGDGGDPATIFMQLFDSLLKNISSINEKLEEMKTLTLHQYYTDSDFFVPAGPMWMQRDSLISTGRCVFFAFILFLAVNVLFAVAICWNDFRK